MRFGAQSDASPETPRGNVVAVTFVLHAITRHMPSILNPFALANVENLKLAVALDALVQLRDSNRSTRSTGRFSSRQVVIPPAT